MASVVSCASELTLAQPVMVDAPLVLPFPHDETEAGEQPMQLVARRKARRAPRKAEKRAASFKPYSFLTWQERRDLELKEAGQLVCAPVGATAAAPTAAAAAATATATATATAAAAAAPAPAPTSTTTTAPTAHSTAMETPTDTASQSCTVAAPVDVNAPPTSSSTPLTAHKNKRHRHHRRHAAAREQPPPAPRNLTQMIVAEHQSPDDPDELDDSFFLGSGRQDSLSSCDASADNFFEKAYEESLYDDLRHMSHDGLIERIRARDRELELLHEQLRALREMHVAS